MILDYDNIQIDKILPQRMPFQFIDKIIEFNKNSVTTVYKIKSNNPLCKENLLSEAGLIENIAQSAAALAGLKSLTGDESVKVGYIGSLKDFKLFGLPNIESEIKTEITTVFEMENARIAFGKVTQNDKVLAEGELKIFLIGN